MKIKLFFTAVIAALASCTLTLAVLWALLGMSPEKFGNMARFMGVMRLIESRYVADVDDTKLIDGAISGMVKSLEDPHSIYMDEEMFRQLRAHTEGTFGGIGVYMGFKDGGVQIISVMEDSPGAKAGLKANDEILAVDGVPVTEFQPEEVALHIRGEKGTDVELLVRREGQEDKTYRITRDDIKMRTVAERMAEDGIGYIRIAFFSENTGKEFRASLEKLEAEGMKGLILDLRENPGGVVTSCVEIGQLLVPKGPIVSVVEKDGEKEVYTSNLESTKYPVVVLIDGNSASASEILAGALQDTGAGTLVGTKSYGKGSVQMMLPMLHEDGLKLTIAKYYTPNGRSIDGTGIEPDVVIELPHDAVSDVQLAKATEVIKEKMQ